MTTDKGFVVKFKEHKIIFDNEDVAKFITQLQPRRKGLGMWVDNCNPSKKAYAYTWLDGKNVKIHHIIAGHPVNGYVVDHINGNGLDNRFLNLRVVTRSQNTYNQKLKGRLPRWVIKQRSGKYQALVRFGLGVYDTPEEAHEVAYKFAMSLHKDLILPEHRIENA